MEESRKWYAVYTKSRSEKKVVDLLEKKHIDCYVPLQKTLKQWSDRKKYVQEVVIKGYVFVHVTEKESNIAIQTDGIVCYVTIEGKKVEIPEKQILALKEFINNEFTESYTNFINGDMVEVIHGSFKGLKGTISLKEGKHKVRMLIEAINQTFELSIPQSLLKKLKAES